MKIALHLEQWPSIELEGSPAECAQFIHKLKTGPSKPDPNNANSIAQREMPAKANIALADLGHPSKKQMPVNRRQGILAVMDLLWQAGERTPRLSQIIDRYQKEYPDEAPDNLDQVIRDLANKTHHVDSPTRGRYRLVKDEK